MVAESNVLFGIVTRPEKVESSMERNPILVTNPSWLSTLQKSPMRTGRSVWMEIPEKRLPSIRCAPRPMAKPGTAENAKTVLGGSPIRINRAYIKPMLEIAPQNRQEGRIILLILLSSTSELLFLKLRIHSELDLPSASNRSNIDRPSET